MSDDYAIPPDALSCDTTSIESSMPSLLMRVSSYMDSPNKRIESLEKSGHLAKLGGKLKTWRKRWFILKNGILSYWKSQNDTNRKPQGHIILDEICRITRADGAATFEISTGKKTYYLTADSIATMEDWIRVLQVIKYVLISIINCKKASLMVNYFFISKLNILKINLSSITAFN